MTKRRKKAAKKTKGSGRTMPPYPIEFRLKVAKLHIEDGHSTGLIADQFGISAFSLLRWSRRYQLHGQKGLENQPRKAAELKPDAPVAKAIIDLKKQYPAHGAKRISDILKRFFLNGASPSTVQRTLHEKGLTQPTKPKREKKLAKPWFFERAKSNQIWQSDIMTLFRSIPRH